MLTCGQLMKIPGNISKQRMIRLSYALSLIFFVCIFPACAPEGSKEITIVRNKGQAVGIAVPKRFLDHVPGDAFSKVLHVRVENNTIAMLGEYTASGNYIIFKPLVPLSPGMNYEVLLQNKIIGKLTIAMPNAAGAPQLLTVYPTADTLPENLLKLYLQFSAPMREGEAMQHVFISDHQGDTLQDILLDLQPELWNSERTALTLWLDPGRIKRDLIPNRQKGNPLTQGKQYTLVISSEWKSAGGLPLKQSYQKNFNVGAWDSIISQPERWKLQLPAAKTNQAVCIQFNEPLDYFLLQETIRIVDANGKPIVGNIKVINKETGFEFTPDKLWQPGLYRMLIGSHLEDLAGNNLNRLFDRDLRVPQPQNDKQIFERAFEIKL